MRRVALTPEDHRGGLLTQASILSLTSDGTRHRPVHRGVWVLESIINRPPPPPPANVPALPTPVGARARRRRCARSWSCTAPTRTAPAAIARSTRSGLAFDNYDAIGRWRTVETVRDGTGGRPEARPERRADRRPQVRRRRGAEEAPARRHRQVRRRLPGEARHLRPAPRDDLLRPRRAEEPRRAGRSRTTTSSRRSSNRWR